MEEPKIELENELFLLLRYMGNDDADTQMRIRMILDKYKIEIECRELSTVLNEDLNETLLRRFIAYKTIKGLSVRSLKYYDIILRSIFRKFNKDIPTITTEDIRGYMAKRLIVDKVSKTTIGNEVRVLSSFFAFMAKEKIIPHNIILDVEAIKTERKKRYAFSDMDIEKIRNATRSNKERALIEILLSTGGRISEVMQIKIKDISNGSCTILGKGAKERRLYFNAKAQLAIEKYLKERNDSNPYLFPKCKALNDQAWEKFRSTKRNERPNYYMNPELVTDDEHMDHSSGGAMVREIGKRAGVSNTHPHRFRRTCATMARRRGMDIEMVSEMLGHESLSTTQIYLSHSEKDMQQAHEKYVI